MLESSMSISPHSTVFDPARLGVGFFSAGRRLGRRLEQRFRGLLMVFALAGAGGGALGGAACVSPPEEARDGGGVDAEVFGPHPWGDLSVEGRAYFFDIGAGLSIEHLQPGPEAEVWVLEHPELRQTLGADGRFSFEGFAEGMEVTLCLEAPTFQPTQTATLTVGATGLPAVTFQVMSEAIRDAVADILLTVDLDDTACQLASTVTAADTQSSGVWAAGEPGAVVELSPAVQPENGPFYFNEDVMPIATLTETTSDGGVLYVNVPVGRYVLEAFKPGVTFVPVTLECRAGWLVNASPPYGVQAF
jgi:hypothetical protein